MALVYCWAPVTEFVILSAQSFAMLASWRGPGITLAWPLLLIAAARWRVTGFVMAGVILRLGFIEACCTDQIMVSAVGMGARHLRRRRTVGRRLRLYHPAWCAVSLRPAGARVASNRCAWRGPFTPRPATR